MTAIGTAIRYDQPIPAAFAHPVEPVRPIPSRPERQSDRGDGAGNARRFEDFREREAQQQAASRQDETKTGRIFPLPGRAQRAPDYAPFIAQQIAQEGLDDGPGDVLEAEAVDSRTAARVSAAYRQAAGDTAQVLGPVGSRQLTI